METNISHLIDPTRTGFLKLGVLLTPAELIEAGRQDMKSATGKSFKLLETSIDPLSAKALRPTAPVELLASMEQAKDQFAKAEALANEAWTKWRAAEREHSRFRREYGGTGLTETGEAALKKIDRAIQARELDFRAAEDCEQQARIEYRESQTALQNWLNNERLRIESARLTATEAEKPKTIPLGERLAALKSKIIG